MPKIIVRISGLLCEWSTIVDAPVTHFMDDKEFRSYYRFMYGEDGMENLEERMRRVGLTGCSSMMDSIDSLLRTNRAGPNETHLTEQEILEQYKWGKI